jgi:C-terminal processing protease CtpA/Prc
MGERSIHWTRLIQVSGDESDSPRVRPVLVVTRPEWARGIASLIKLANEYRDGGLLVTNVGPNSQAASAGIERGDVLLRYDGVPLEDAQRLRNLEGITSRGAAPRQVPLEAVRGAREMTFTVTGGRLGITVSAMLHRWRSMRRATVGLIPVPESGERPATDKPTLVEVPRELVPQVVLLADVLQRSGNAKQRKKAESLLVTAAALA